MRKITALACAAALLAGGATMALAQDKEGEVQAKTPEIMREFRSVWVATVANIDWPSRKDLSTEEQQKELLAILDKCRELNMNAVIFQVRPACDAMYASKLEPWSEYLTGQMGKAPEPFWDPLEFAVEESHKRGLELHTWFNPYRARLKASKLPISDDHISKTHPEMVRDYGSYLWLDPGMKEVQDHSMAVIMDVVKRYDVDGVHIDDYFYPYKERADKDDPKSPILDFPDDASYEVYQKAGGKLERDDWRRDNVNKFVERMYKEVKAEKPHVKVGISPFGIWKPGFPEQIKGFNQYEELYADAKLWLNEGWVDYWTPQLYWNISNPDQSFPVLLKWWADENTHSRHLWPGLYTGLVSSEPDHNRKWHPKEIRYQIAWTRVLTDQPGHAHFSMKVFMRNGAGINDELTTSVYSEPALVPATPWLGTEAPSAPSVTAKLDGDKVAIKWEPATDSPKPAFVWGVQVKTGKEWQTMVLPASERGIEVPAEVKNARFDKVLVTAVDRLGNASEAAEATTEEPKDEE